MDTVYNISLDRLGLEDNIDTVYNISPYRLGLEDNIDTVYKSIHGCIDLKRRPRSIYIFWSINPCIDLNGRLYLYNIDRLDNKDK